MSRSYNRSTDTARPVTFTPGFTTNADGSVLVAFGNTKVICTASLEEKVPSFLRNSKRGWVTAEYGMLPGSTHTRSNREAAKGKQSGRTVEISRLIGRSLRTCVDMELLGERSVTVDCDVIQADGGTRTASITGGCVALILCLWKHRESFDSCPVTRRAVALSMGIVGEPGEVFVDLDYSEDSAAEVDMNLIMDHQGNYIEIQGTAEGEPFSGDQLSGMLRAGRDAILKLAASQREAIVNDGVDDAWVP